MKYIFRILRLSMSHRVGIVIVCVILISGIGAIVYGWYVSSLEHDKIFAAYRAASEREMQAALVPGVKDNAVRRELDRTLAEVLAREMSDSERLELAQHGLEILALAEIQIDAIGEAGEAAHLAIEELSQSSLVAGFIPTSFTSRELVSLSNKRSGIISDIRGLSYRANFHTEEIFKKIVADQGRLTAVHVASLNSLIPKVEEQFNERSNLYFDLESTNNQMETILAEL